MSQKTNGVKWSKQVDAKSRRSRVIDRLTAQLSRGTKTTKEGVVPLTEPDINRINREIQILKERI